MKRILLGLAIVMPLVAADPWKMPYAAWTEEDARLILQSSPWANSIPESKARVRWVSARPIQLAMEKLKVEATRLSGSGTYAIAIVGGIKGDSAVSVATLKANGRDPVSSIETRIIGDTAVFFFPRRQEFGQPIVFRLPLGIHFGNSIEFQTKIGGWNVRQRFHPRKMIYEGRTEL